jgi:hypothetical protein
MIAVTVARARGCAALLLGGCLLFACELSGSTDAGGAIDVPDVPTDPTKVDGWQDEALGLVASLFPDLPREEVASIITSLDFSEILALRNELKAARAAAAEFVDHLTTTAAERVAQRNEDLAAHNGGFPQGLAAVGRVCRYDASHGRGTLDLSGVFNGRQSVSLSAANVALHVDGVPRAFSLSCLAGGQTVDVVFLIDITGSMTNVIHAVRNSVVDFVDLLEARGVRGTVSVVTFQDTVGVNRGFQEPALPGNIERSPFFVPISLSDSAQVAALRAFVNRLEANQGADVPENLSAAIDFARSNVIGTMAGGQPNVIGDGREDPIGASAFPALTSDRQVFVALTDSTFHGDDRGPGNSSLRGGFVPRDAATILASLHRTGTTVHVSDPSWVDSSLSTSSASVDSDFWAIHTGGVGEDSMLGYSLTDLELVVVAEQTGLLDITLDKIIGSSCTLQFEGELSATAQVELHLELATASYRTPISIERF